MTNSEPKKGIDVFLFTTTFILIVSAVLWGALDNASFIATMIVVKDYITLKLGWFMVIAINFFLFLLIYLAFSRFGNRRFGNDDDRPEFSTFSWIALLFGCGIGAGYCFWPIGESLWHYFNTPYIAESGTPEALVVARGITLLHWGLHQWTIFCIGGLLIGYPAFRLNKPLTVSVGLYGLMGDKVYTSVWGRLAELCGAFATLTGVAATLGLGLMVLSAGIKDIFGFEAGVWGQSIIMLVIIIVYTAAAWSGLDKGIKFLGDANVWICLTWFTFILLAGPTALLLGGMVDSWGAYINNFGTMAFFTDSTGEANGWPRDWSIFYYLWNISWAPFVGGFIARISRGRTIREYIFGVLCVPAGVALVWFGVLGTAAQYVEVNGITDLWEQVQIDPALGIYVLVDAFSGGVVIKLIVLLSAFAFLVTSADAAAFFLAMQMNRGALNPDRFQMLLWGVLFGALAVVLQSLSGLKGVQMAGVISGAPFIFFMCFMVVAFFKVLFAEDKEIAEKKAQAKV